eukprot:549486-Hanusia_phi.AAC.4
MADSLRKEDEQGTWQEAGDEDRRSGMKLSEDLKRAFTLLGLSWSVFEQSFSHCLPMGEEQPKNGVVGRWKMAKGGGREKKNPHQFELFQLQPASGCVGERRD